MTLIYMNQFICFNYKEWNQANISYFVDVGSIHLTNLLSFLDHAQVVLAYNVHCTEEPENGPIIDPHLLIQEHLCLG
jgi:hypothetical protein